MRFVLLLFVVMLVPGCLRYDYLDPRGSGRTYSVANPCPFAYRVMEVRAGKVPDVRIQINAFQVGDYGFKQLTLLIAVSDKRSFGYQVGQGHVATPSRAIHVLFPKGATVRITSANGEIKQGQLEGGAGGLLFSVPISSTAIDSFSVDIPPIDIDGEVVDVGRVSFKRTSATLYGINC